ncbi:2-oxoacid:acceptor oxidoreductase subunit alpha [bacterium]|nr:MAG: 2-oxoacid:acceptor oxidoreductase subunit alpha [bacterium]
MVNDLTIRAATVNGSGSQSSNLVLTHALVRLGIPVAPKNIFPSNIEGLPTWFDVRLSPQGYQCRSGGVDVLVALNLVTWESDVRDVKPGGAIVHDASFTVHGVTARDDVAYYPVPFTELSKEHFPQGSPRKYLINMIYVGVLAQLLTIDPAVVEAAVRDQFKRKAAALELNLAAVRLGYEYARDHFTKADSHHVEPIPGGTAGLLLMDGNRAAALGCVMGGCTVAAWYPITPSTSLCEAFIEYCDRYRTDPQTKERRAAIIQAEDELAAIGMVVGAGWAGARAMTSTSGPGLSLMAETAGFAYYAEIPSVIFDVQRAGPSTGLPTRTMQGDISFAAQLSHGDTKHIVLLPATVAESYTFALDAFDLAERFQTPVFVLSDLDLGMNLWLTPSLPYPEHPFDRGKVLSAQDLSGLATWGRYRDVDGDGIPYRTVPGTPHPNAGYFTRGSGHDEDSRYSERPDVYQHNLDRLTRKYDTARGAVPAPSTDEAGRDVAILAYGTTHHAVVEARDLLAQQGLEVDYLRVRALPFSPQVEAFIARHRRVYVVEQNRDSQLFALLRAELPAHLTERLRSVRHYTGEPIHALAVSQPLLSAESAAADAAVPAAS